MSIAKLSSVASAIKIEHFLRGTCPRRTAQYERSTFNGALASRLAWRQRAHLGRRQVVIRHPRGATTRRSGDVPTYMHAAKLRF